MAFGKDPRLAVEGGSFRQQSQSFASNRTGRGTKGRVPYFVNEYKPTLNGIDTIRLVKGAYLQQQAVGEGDKVEAISMTMPYTKFTDHFHGGFEKSIICSAGVFKNLKAKRDPCRGCDIFWETAVRTENTGRLESPIMSRQEKYAFGVLDYSDYHKVEQMDRDTGKARMNNRTNEPFFNWNKCDGQGCANCAKGKELKHGDMRHWSMSYTHFQALRNAELLIGNSCSRCGAYPGFDGVAPIQSLAWSCPNCGSPVINVTTTELKTDEMRNITDSSHICKDCKHEVFLTELITCTVCEPRGQQGLRAELWDVDLKVGLTPTNTKAKTLTVSGFSPPRPVDPAYAHLAKPVDLISIFTPDAWEFQIERFGAPTPAAQRTPVTGTIPSTQQPAQPYGPKT
jgi:hypothetical protein